MEERNITFNHIYNVDESAFSTVQSPQKIVVTKGRKQVDGVTSAEREARTTVVCATNPIIAM